MLVLSKAATQILAGTGLHVKTDALGLTETAVAEGDKIKHTVAAVDRYYVVDSVVPQPVGNLIAYYEVNLTYLGDYANSG